MPGRLPSPDLPAERRSVLVIATGVYGDPELAALRAPARDALDMAEVLSDPRVGGFEVTALTDRSAQEIRVGIEDFLSGRGVGDLVVVYMSCHGVRDARGRLHFAGTDTRKTRLASTTVESGWLLDRLDECRARRQVLILDCCFSGAFTIAGTKGEDEAEAQLQRQLIGHGRGRVVLTASRATEYSFEGQALPGALTRSVFTAGLVEGLRTGGADRDNDGLVSVDDAYDYAYTYVQAHAAAQTPQRWTYGAEGKIWLARNPAGRSVTPAALPDDIKAGLDNRHPDLRIGALAGLVPRLTDPDPARVPAASASLKEAGERDIPRVANAARAHLDQHGDSATEPQSPPSAPRPALPVAGYTHLRAPNAPAVQAWALSGHARRSAVVAVAFSPDGTLLATAGTDDTVRFWDPYTCQPVGEPIAGQAGRVLAVAFSPDGALLATAGDHAMVRLRDPRTRKPVGRPLAGHQKSVNAVAFSPDGALLASASDDKTVRLWDPRTHQPIGEPLTAHRDLVIAVAFSPDGALLASAGYDKTVRLWDSRTRQPIGEPLTAHAGILRHPRAVAFSPDGSLLASAGEDKTVRLWDPRTHQPIGEPLIGHRSEVEAVAFSPDGTLLATVGMDSTVRLWDPRTRQAVGQPLGGHPTWVRAVAFSPDGTLLATVGNNGAARLWGLGGPSIRGQRESRAGAADS